MITTPEQARTAEQRVEDARSVLAFMEIEQKRLSAMIQADEYSLGQLRNASIEAQSELDALNIGISDAKLSLGKLDMQEAALIDDLAAMSRELDEARGERDGIMADIEAEKADMKSQGVDLASRERAVDKRESSCDGREESISAKLEAIRAFRATL